MSDAKPKTAIDYATEIDNITQDRDHALELWAATKAELAASEETLRQVQLGSAELRLLYQNSLIAGESLLWQLEATQAAFVALQRENAELIAEIERMRPVCDAAIGHSITKKLFWQIGRDVEPALCDTIRALDRSVAEYRKQQEVKPDA